MPERARKHGDAGGVPDGLDRDHHVRIREVDPAGGSLPCQSVEDPFTQHALDGMEVNAALVPAALDAHVEASRPHLAEERCDHLLEL